MIRARRSRFGAKPKAGGVFGNVISLEGLESKLRTMLTVSALLLTMGISFTGLGNVCLEDDDGFYAFEDHQCHNYY